MTIAGVIFLTACLAISIYYFETSPAWDIQPVMTLAEVEQTFEIKVLLPSPTELQERLNVILAEANKPLIDVDGKVGFAVSQFRQAYEAAYCHQQGVYNCQKAGMKDEFDSHN